MLEAKTLYCTVYFHVQKCGLELWEAINTIAPFMAWAVTYEYYKKELKGFSHWQKESHS